MAPSIRSRLSSLLLLLIPTPATAQVVDLCGPISDSTTGPLVTGTVYRLTCDVQVPLGETLTVQPGVVVKGPIFRQIDIHGTLLVQGTDVDPVHFTSIDDDSVGGDTEGDGFTEGVPGTWRGLTFHSTSGSSVVDHAIVRFCGNANLPGILLRDAPVTVTNTILRDCSVEGMRLDNASVGAIVSGCTFLDNAREAVDNVPIDAVPGFTNNFAAGNAGGDFLRVVNTVPTQDVVIGPDNCINGALYMPNHTIPAGVTWTLLPGTILKFPAFAHLQFDGRLIALGTESDPVVLTDYDDDDWAGDTNGDGESDGTPGRWRGLRFSAPSTGSQLEHVILRYTGNANLAGIQVNGGDVALSRCTIQDGADDGLDLMSTVTNSTIEECVFQDNAYHPVVGVSMDMVPAFRNNTASGNGNGDFMELSTVMPTLDVTIAPENCLGGALVIPPMTLPLGRRWTFLPGVVLKANNFNRLTIQGSFEALGTPAEPVVYTHIEDDEWVGDTDGDGETSGTPGTLRGFWFQSGGDPSRLENTIVRFTGNASLPAIQSESDQLELIDVRVEHGTNSGFYLEGLAPTSRGLVAHDFVRYGFRLRPGTIDVDHATASGCGLSGFHADGGWVGRVTNSISWGNSGPNYSQIPAGQLFFSNGDPALEGIDGNINEDPLFVDEAGGDFHLSFGSPCIDAGDPGAPLDDDGTRTDMGAHVYDQCGPRIVCVTSANSNGPGANIGWSGSTSVEANDLVLEVAGAAVSQPGLFYYGPNEIQIPFGDGVRCIGAGGIGIFRLHPPVITDGTGFAARLLDLDAPPTNGGPGEISVGETWYFQFWYRDPAAQGAGFNLSDALAVRFCE